MANKQTANIDLCLLGHAIENANSRTISDCKMFAKILLRLYFPLAQLEEASYNERKNDGFSDFQKHVDDGRLGQALRVRFPICNILDYY